MILEKQYTHEHLCVIRQIEILLGKHFDAPSFAAVRKTSDWLTTPNLNITRGRRPIDYITESIDAARYVKQKLTRLLDKGEELTQGVIECQSTLFTEPSQTTQTLLQTSYPTL